MTDFLPTQSDFSDRLLAVGLVPFAGIAFLWFMGVVRDRLGHLEDQFFSTIYFGSGLLFLAMLFIWAAIAGTILTGFDLDPGVLADDRSGYAFGRMLMDEITSVYALRMAGVFMISTGVIWTSTGVMPRWLAIITLVVALGLLVGTGFIFFWWLRLSFPAWVLLVSIYIFRTSRRNQPESSVVA